MRVLVMAAALAACNAEPDETDVTDGPDPATVPLAGLCDLSGDWGGFAAISDPVNVGVQGSVANGIVPVHVLEASVEMGDCILWQRNNPFCDPSCDPGETCDFDGNCLPYPSNQDLGTVTVDGLVAPVSMEPVFPGNTYFNTSLPNPPYAASELVTLSMPGGAYGPITLYGVGFDVPVPAESLWSVEAGVDLIVRWDAPTAEVVRSEVLVSINIDQHGTSPNTLRCVFDDDGEGTVPAGIVQELVNKGVTGFPTGLLERRTGDRAELAGAGCMDFTLSAPILVEVDVEGFTPCVSQNDCPDGMDCNLELQICE